MVDPEKQQNITTKNGWNHQSSIFPGSPRPNKEGVFRTIQVKDSYYHGAKCGPTGLSGYFI